MWLFLNVLYSTAYCTEYLPVFLWRLAWVLYTVQYSISATLLIGPGTKSNMTHMWQSCLKWSTISHMWSIFCSTCVKYASPFFWHMVCQIRLKWSQQRIIVTHILHNMCQMWLCTGARFTVQLWVVRVGPNWKYLPVMGSMSRYFLKVSVNAG
jgi:hypothetical protein